MPATSGGSDLLKPSVWLKRAVLTVVVAGVVLGLWRVLGDGAGVTDPEFWPNAERNLTELSQWLARMSRRGR